MLDVGSDLRDFADTGALVCALDLLITVDSAPAHLAGALGRLGISGVSDVRQGKRFELEIDDSVDDAELEKIAESLLANTVIEDWKVTRIS